jgi:hypothetical protein
MKKLLLSSMFLLLGLCNQVQAQNEPKATNEPSVYKGVTDQACAVEVAFGSYGSGIDAQSFEKVQALIKEKNLASMATSIGREGEQRICLPLTELKKKAKVRFISQLKKLAKEGKLVSISIR